MRAIEWSGAFAGSDGLTRSHTCMFSSRCPTGTNLVYHRSKPPFPLFNEQGEASEGPPAQTARKRQRPFLLASPRPSSTRQAIFQAWERSRGGGIILRPLQREIWNMPFVTRSP